MKGRVSILRRCHALVHNLCKARHQPPRRRQHSPCAECSKVGPSKAFSCSCQRLHQNLSRRVLPMAGVDVEDGGPVSCTGQIHVHLAVKPAGPSESRVDAFRPVGCANHNDVSTVNDAIHEGEQSSNHAGVHLVTAALASAAIGDQGVQLVQKYDGGRLLHGLVKQDAEGAFRIARKLPEAIGPLAGEEGDRHGGRLLTGPGKCTCKQSLAAARHSM
mmetsp:Transcript_7381/g.20845  ORF Transcript_7381/g.20845 Transcript_7381/m.20845 type:complete len:217 (+) Transcript_7381:3113-3763(+)